ncbi:MAG: AmmeMemoRadiSam system radical SAM enzyme [Candidatus Brocadiia bacterium]
MKYTRRAIIKTALGACAATALGRYAPGQPAVSDAAISPVKAAFYDRLKDNAVECLVCPRKCRVPPGGRGVCGNKENREGKFYSLVHSYPCTVTLSDPIEKKPFFHFLPGAKTLSLSTSGCNLSCKFCQNWEISQAKPEDVRSVYVPPDKIIGMARENKLLVVAFTYAEPTVYYEYMYDIAGLCRKNDIKPVMVSNGYIKEEPLKKLCTQLSAVKIDLKSFSDEFYKKYCGGTLQPVLDTLLTLKKTGIWYEIVVLLIPNLNDSAEEIRRMCEWIKAELGPDVPVHFFRFHPAYQLTNIIRTPVKTLESAYDIGRKAGLNYVYVGNVSPHPAESTYCPKCGKVLVERGGYTVKQNVIRDGKCLDCQNPVSGVWSA